MNGTVGFSVYCGILFCLFTAVSAQTSSAHVVEVGDAVDLICTKPSGAQVVWDRSSAPQTSIAVDGVLQTSNQNYKLTVSGNTHTLTIKAVTVQDADNYRCYTLFDTDYDIHTVTVIAYPELVELVFPEGGINDDTTAAINAISYASKPQAQFSWMLIYADGTEKPLTSSERQIANSNGTVTVISQVTLPVTKAEYRSKVKVKVTLPEMSSYEKTLTEQIPVNLRPQPPQVVSGFKVNYTEGEVVWLVCSAHDALPASTVFWTWQGDIVNGLVTTTEAENGTFSTTSRLRVRAHRDYHENEFRCFATNKVLEDEGEQPLGTEVYYFTLMYTPTVTIGDQSQDTPLFEGGSVTLDCGVEAVPPPLWSGWMKNGDRIEASDTISISNDFNRPTLSIASVTSADKGRYVCASTNEIGTSYSEAINLEVLHSPYCDTNQLYQYAVRVGETVQLQCHVEANPANTVYFGWSENSEPYVVSPGMVDTRYDDFAYSLRNYTVSTSADYKNIDCKATNGIGSTQHPCVLQVLPPGPAEPLSSCKPLNKNDTTLKLRCYEKFRGGSVPHYALQMSVRDHFQTVVNASAAGMFMMRTGMFMMRTRKTGRDEPQTGPQGIKAMSMDTLADADVTDVEAMTVQLQSNEVEYVVQNLLPMETYYFRVCSNNEEFWDTINCGEQFQVTMDSGNIAYPPMAVMSDSMSDGTIAAVVILSLLAAGVIVGLLIYLICGCGNNSGKATVTTSPPAVQMVEVNAQTQDHSYAIIEDPNNPAFANIDGILKQEGVSIRQPSRNAHVNRSFTVDEFGDPVNGRRVEFTGAGHPVGMDGDTSFRDVDLASLSTADPYAHSISSIETADQTKTPNNDEMKEDGFCKQS